MADIEITNKFRFDDLEHTLIVELEGEVKEDLLRRGINVKRRIQDLILHRALDPSGDLSRSIQGSIEDNDGESWIMTIESTAEHAIWFEEGTGIYGPRKSFIFPRTHQFMWFTPTGGSAQVRALRVKGQKPHHVFRDGLDAFNDPT